MGGIYFLFYTPCIIVVALEVAAIIILPLMNCTKYTIQSP